MTITESIITNNEAITHIAVHTDGACSGNPGPGGWAAIIIGRNHDAQVYRRDLSGGESVATTNNRIELMAAIKALEWIKDRESPGATTRVHLQSDSEYVVKGMNEWLPKWLTNGWKGSGKTAVKNRDLWTMLHELAAEMDATWSWVRGHSGDPLNEAVDALAVAAIPKVLRPAA